MEFQFVKLAEHSDGVTVLTIDRPEQENFLSVAVLRELLALFDWLERERSSLRVLVVTGAGREAFIGGVDPQDLVGLTSAQAEEMSRLGQRFCRALERSRFVTIAAVNGRALGGGLEVILACDLAIAVESAIVCQIETRVDIVPGFGGSLRLARRVGAQRARWMTYTAAFVDAKSAKEYGIFLETTSDEALLPRALEIAASIVPNGAAGIASAKALLAIGIETPVDAHNEAESRAFGLLVSAESAQTRFKQFVASRAAAAKA